MREFSKQAFSAYKKNLAGLPSFCRLVMLEIFEYCEHQSGTITIDSLDKLSHNDFYVEPLRGRQKETINGDTIRNAFRTIKKAKPDHFKFTTVNQRIVIDMPFLRELYQTYEESTKVAAVFFDEVFEAGSLSEPEDSHALESYKTRKVAEDLAAASFCSIKDLKNKTNKQQTTTVALVRSFEMKAPISDDFYPSITCIELALNRGLLNVTDDVEIDKFIRYNQANGSLWADYNPVFINWLERDLKHQQIINNKQQGQFRRNSHERRANKSCATNFTMEAMYHANRNAVTPDGLSCEPQLYASDFIAGEYQMVMDTTSGNLRSAVFE